MKNKAGFLYNQRISTVAINVKDTISRKKNRSSSHFTTILNTNLRQVKLYKMVTYHPPVVDIRGQLDVVSGPHR